MDALLFAVGFVVGLPLGLLIARLVRRHQARQFRQAVGAAVARERPGDVIFAIADEDIDPAAIITVDWQTGRARRSR